MMRCGLCKGLLELTTPEEEMIAECDELFGPTPAEQRVAVCDDCFLYMTSQVPPPGAGRQA